MLRREATPPAPTEPRASQPEPTTAQVAGQATSGAGGRIGWGPRASQYPLEQHRADYAQLLNQVPAVDRLYLLNGQGREQLRLSRTKVAVNAQTDFSRDARFTETVTRGVSFSPIYFEGAQPFMSIAVAHSGFNADVTAAEIDLRFLSDFLGDAQVGKAAFAYMVDSRGQVIASSSKGPEVSTDLSKLPQVAAQTAPVSSALESDTGAEGNSELSASSEDPKLTWDVIFDHNIARTHAPI